jgi:hypothetical protein
MNNKFDELARGLAQSVTRRQALRKFGVGLAGMALACFGLGSNAGAGAQSCATSADCGHNQTCCSGTCSTLLDRDHCGSCFNVCPPGTTCKNVTFRGPRGVIHGVVCA